MKFVKSVFFVILVILMVQGVSMSAQQSPKVRAPEITGGRGWLNTDKPLSIAALKGKVVLLDFWTYGCINCIHIIPDLKKLEAKYANQLVVIGIHSAKFQNEKDTENIRRIILRYEIEHPVYNDSEYAVWQSYGVRAWPTQVLIDPAGTSSAAFPAKAITTSSIKRSRSSSPRLAAEASSTNSLSNSFSNGRKSASCRSHFPVKFSPTRKAIDSSSLIQITIASS